jgi:hypothetical protein
MRPATCRDERDENGHGNRARDVRLRPRLEDVRALLLGGPLNPSLQGRRERPYLDMAPRTRV